MRQTPDASANASQMLAEAIDTARAAGAEILRVYDELCPPDKAQSLAPLATKHDDSPLSHADLAAHDVICKRLKERFPAIAVVSEEDGAPAGGPAAAGQNGPYWLVDPLDGTKEFLEHSGEFTVNIALVHAGAVLMGVVFAPALGELYWGSAAGAFRQIAGRTEAIHVAPPRAHGQPLRVVASRSHMNPATARFIEALGAHELVQAGSSLKFCRVAEGRADVYPRLGPTCEWDTAAAQGVLEAAGGHVLTLEGAQLRYSKSAIVNPPFVASSMRRSWADGAS